LGDLEAASLERRLQLHQREELLWCEHAGLRWLGAANLEQRFAEGGCRSGGHAVVAVAVDGACGEALSTALDADPLADRLASGLGWHAAATSHEGHRGVPPISHSAFRDLNSPCNARSRK